MTTTILVIYHSQGGNTRQMAEAVARGVDSIDNAAANLKPAGDTTLQDLTQCSGIVIGTPEYFGYMSGMIKDFFDRTYEAATADTRRFFRPYGLFVSAGNDGRNTRDQVERICKGFPFKKVYDPIISRGKVTGDILGQCRELGQTLAAGCDLGIY